MVHLPTLVWKEMVHLVTLASMENGTHAFTSIDGHGNDSGIWSFQPWGMTLWVSTLFSIW